VGCVWDRFMERTDFCILVVRSQHHCSLDHVAPLNKLLRLFGAILPDTFTPSFSHLFSRKKRLSTGKKHGIASLMIASNPPGQYGGLSTLLG
jgi:hypothetical protein